jgi:hypothetical protein
LQRNGPEWVEARLPDVPLGANGEWQNDKQMIATGQARLRSLLSFQGELWTFMTGLANSPSTALSTPARSPATYLLSWRQILDAVGLKNNDGNRRNVRDLNERYQGPIIPPPQGGQPRANKTKLLEWWNGLEIRWETEGSGLNTEATIEARHAYGKTGEVVPHIEGYVKKKRRTKGR